MTGMLLSRPRAKRNSAWRKNLVAFWSLSVALGCGPSARDVRRSDAFYERCRVLRDTEPQSEVQCFEDWLREYSEAQPATRIAYAEERIHVADPNAHAVLEMATGEEGSAATDAHTVHEAHPVSGVVETSPSESPTSRRTSLRPEESGDEQTARYQQGTARRSQRHRVLANARGCSHCTQSYGACADRCGETLSGACVESCRLQARLCAHGCY